MTSIPVIIASFSLALVLILFPIKIFVDDAFVVSFPNVRHRHWKRRDKNERDSDNFTAASPNGFYILDPNKFRNRFQTSEALLWATNMIPFIDLPQANYSDVLTAFYYRAQSYRKHIVKTEDDGYVVTEFLPEVSWAGKHNTISAAAGHHILEGRWFHDERFLNDYITFWFREGSGREHIDTYTNWILFAAYERSLLTGNISVIQEVLDEAIDVFRSKYTPRYLSNSTTNKEAWGDSGRVCWVQQDGNDAMEVSVSGYGCRPTIASAMFGEASVIAAASRVSNASAATADEFERWANFSRSLVLEQLWNPDIGSFAVITPPHVKHKNKDENLARGSCDLNALRPSNQRVPVRELLAFMPWYYGKKCPLGSLIPQEHATRFSRQFRYLLETSGKTGFSSPWGLRTLEHGCPCYNYSWTHADCWNGPSWPYETSRVLTAVANLLNDYPESAAKQGGMNRPVFDRLLRQYAYQHTATTAINDTAKPPGSGHIFEVVHPDEGYWIDRLALYGQNNSNRNMGDHYNHSTFLDIVLSYLLGILPADELHSSDSLWLTINPLIDPERTTYFAIDHVKYRGHFLSIIWDKDGSRYDRGAGLTVMVNGHKVAWRDSLGRLEVSFPACLRKNITIQ